ncbi:MAG: DUF2934 domain-containing protein [Candidatus Omnitrophota bacterium]
MAKIAMGQARESSRKTSTNTNQSLQEEISKLAYQLFVERGYQNGHDQEDWLRAERIVKARRS